MAGETLSANMSLPVPGVSVTDGPQWAIDINSCFSLLDAHDHSPGYGVQITPSGMDINADLPLSSNNLTLARSVRFDVQNAPLALASDLGCLYVSGVDLYFNDENGNQIQITQSGGVAGTPGSISNLVAPASASYVAANQTFVWQQDTNKAANLDAASIILRNTTVSSYGLTLAPPNAMASDTTITLPTLPGSSKILRIDNAGSISATLDVDNSTIAISSNNLIIKTGGITDTQISASANIDGSKLLNNSVGAAKLANSSITDSQVSSISGAVISSIPSTALTGTPFSGYTGSGGTVYSNPAGYIAVLTVYGTTVVNTGHATEVGFKYAGTYSYGLYPIVDDGLTTNYIAISVVLPPSTSVSFYQPSGNATSTISYSGYKIPI